MARFDDPRRVLVWGLVAIALVAAAALGLTLVRGVSGLPGLLGRSAPPQVTHETVMERLRDVAKLVASEMTVKADAFMAEWLGLELAVANQSTRLRKKDLIAGWDLSGRVEEFPVLTLYGTFSPGDEGWSTYIGPRLIIGKLDGVRLTQGDSVATVSASSTGGGIGLGQVYGFQNFNVFAELDWSMLRFETRNWTVPGNLAASRGTLPQHLALSGFRFAFGLQIGFDK